MKFIEATGFETLSHTKSFSPHNTTMPKKLVVFGDEGTHTGVEGGWLVPSTRTRVRLRLCG